MPLTRRAKALMMLESTIALVTLVVVAARSINTLGTSAHQVAYDLEVAGQKIQPQIEKGVLPRNAV